VFAEMLTAVIAWWRGGSPTLKEQTRERQVVDLLVEEMAEEDGADEFAPTVSTKAQPKRRMRRDSRGGTS
jgi:hypothetical protein